MAVEYFIAWWNLENLFDEENAPPDRRPDKVQRAIGRELRGWSAAVRDRKIDQLASVIAQMNNGAGPDLLGICEVENRHVVDLLVDNLSARLGRTSYAVVHADSQDRRAIDVAFIYDDTLFDVPADAVSTTS